MNWGILLMYGGAIALGAAVSSSGAARLDVAADDLALGGRAAPMVVAVISGMSIVLTEAMSNSAVVALLMPLTIGIATDYGIDARVMALVVAVPAGLGFTLPIGTPANAIAYSSGYLSIRDMMVPGAILARVVVDRLQPGRLVLLAPPRHPHRADAVSDPGPARRDRRLLYAAAVLRAVATGMTGVVLAL